MHPYEHADSYHPAAELRAGDGQHEPRCACCSRVAALEARAALLERRAENAEALLVEVRRLIATGGVVGRDAGHVSASAVRVPGDEARDDASNDVPDALRRVGGAESV